MTCPCGPIAISPKLAFNKSGHFEAAGAKVTGLGMVGSFSPLEKAPGPSGANFGDIAIGPQGQVMVTYQSPISGSGPSKIYVNLDADGLGSQGFGPAILVTSTQVGGF